MTGPLVLVCTVGGSHQPILTALGELAPDHVVFICTGRDPGTGRAGSVQQIRGKGLVIRASPDDAQPGLPNIPVQAGLTEERFEELLVPVDDLDAAFVAIDEKLASLQQRFPEARLVADYTGGTKTMTAALVAAALEHPRVELQVVTGNRANLVRVLDGTQYAAPASVDGIRMGRAIQAQVAAWQRFGYEEAAQGLARVPAPRAGELRVRLSRARDLSVAFAAWDRFDHREALRLFELYAPLVAEKLGLQLQALRILAGEHGPRRESLQVWDLWLNAERRAAAGRYDDAVARVYRVIEWTAQWILRAQAGLDTADIPPDRIPPGVATAPGRPGKHQAGLFAAWQLVAAHTHGAAAQVFHTHREALRDLLDRRNGSILAHGFKPIDAKGWKAAESWLAERFIPMLRDEMALAHINAPFAQLPNRYTFDA